MIRNFSQSLRASGMFILAGLFLLAAWISPAALAQEDSADTIQVDEAAICLGVEDHQPVDAAESFPADTPRLYCWNRVLNGEGQALVHTWIHEGTTRATVELTIGSPSWRTYSSKQILPAWKGSWEVKIMTPEGVVLKTVSFIVQ